MEKSEKQKGYINIHIDIETKQVYASNRPYLTIEEAEKGIMHGIGIEKVGCFEIEFTKAKSK